MGGVTESTRFAVLGLTLEGPTYAYAIAEEIRRWPLDPSEIPNQRAFYRAVEWLVDERFVVVRDDDVRAVVGGVQPVIVRGAPRRLIEATARGREEFDAWLRSPIENEDDLLWRVGAARVSDLTELVHTARVAERSSLSRLRDEITPNAAALVEGQSWKTTKLALLNVIKGRQLQGQVAVIRDAKALLTEVQREIGGVDR